MERNTRQKEAILRVLHGTQIHPDAGWVYQQVKKEIPNISLGTVYRNLKMLKENGLVNELDFAGSQGRFDGDVSDHYHFRCKKCGRIYDIDEPVDKSIEKIVAGKTGFQVTGHRLEIVGFCVECQLPEG